MKAAWESRMDLALQEHWGGPQGNEEVILKISVIGSGYVGLVTGACLADSGNDVVCVDIDQAKIDRFSREAVPL